MTSPRTLQEESDRRERLTEALLDLVDEGDFERIRTQLEALHPADQAEFLEEVEEPTLHRLLRDLTVEQVAELLEFLDEEPRARYLTHLEPKTTAQMLMLVDDDLAAEMVAELPDEQVEPVLAHLDDPTAITEILSFPEDSAGRWMDLDVIRLRSDWTVDEALDYIRREGPDADQPFYLYTVDEKDRLEGVIDLRRLIVADPRSNLSNIAVNDVISVQADMDQEAAAERLRYYDLMALPVTNTEGKLLGVLTADDVLDVQVEEATEDIYLQAGLDAESQALSTVGATLKRRAPWLLVNLLIGFFSAFLVSLFEDTITQVAVLAAFMPIVAGHGGNTGCQTTTLVVRGLALGDIYRRDVPKLVFKEFSFGLLYGLVAGLLTGGLAYFLTGNLWLAGVVSFAMVANITVAGLAGSLIPLGLRALKIDPALASTVWLTTFTDWVGFLVLLGIGTMLMSHLV